MKTGSDLHETLANIKRNDYGGRRHAPMPVDVRTIRKRLRMSQLRFARRFGFSVSAVRHWERGDRRPRGPALALLNVIAFNHRVVMMAIPPVRDHEEWRR